MSSNVESAENCRKSSMNVERIVFSLFKGLEALSDLRSYSSSYNLIVQRNLVENE